MDDLEYCRVLDAASLYYNLIIPMASLISLRFSNKVLGISQVPEFTIRQSPFRPIHFPSTINTPG